MKETIMTERFARRGTPVITEYSADFLQRVLVRDRASSPVVTLPADRSVASAKAWLLSEAAPTHQGFPVIDDEGKVIGVLTRRDLLAPRGDEQLTVRALIHRPPVVVSGHQSLRDAADLMVGAKVGRLPVVASDGSRRVVGILSRSDLLAAHERRLDEGRRRAEATLWG
jgi:CBS domain-containing protein